MSKRLDQVEWKLDCLQSRMDALVKADEDPCWEGYEQAGTKEKGGRTVPNCVEADDDGPSEEQLRKIVRARNPSWSEAQVEVEVKRSFAGGGGSKTGPALKSKALRVR